MIEKKRLKLHGWVIMENHLHLIASALDLSRETHDFKSFTARKIVDFLTVNRHTYYLNRFMLLKKEHKIHQSCPIWEERCHPEMIINMQMLKRKLDYIHYNPVRRGYVSEPGHWRYSSFLDYHGENGLLPIKILEL
jgi:putative transposase